MEWWNSLSLPMQILWGVTLVASLIFVIQSIMTFIGADADSDFGDGADFDSGSSDFSTGDSDTSGADGADSDSGSNLLTFRNLVNFCMGFGWSAILLGSSIGSVALLMIVSVIIGVGLVAAVIYLFKWMSSMQQSGNIDLYQSAVGCEGSVYLRIPGERKGEGKVQITINCCVREYNAVTDGPALPTGAFIKVVEVVNNSTVLVEEVGAMII